jgi:putative FmdB family regulatory protein
MRSAMPRYDFRCDDCGVQDEYLLVADAGVFCPQCGKPMRKLDHYHTLQIRVPAAFRVNTEQIMGPPGSKTRDAFEAGIRKGEITPVGRGSRWV